MSRTPFMPLWVADFLAKTMDLDAKQAGAYLLILMSLWTHDGKLPFDQRKLQRIARCGRDWPTVWASIECYFTVEDGQISNRRLTEELHKVATKREVNSRSGALGGKAKARKYKEEDIANANSSLKQPEPEPEPETETKKEREERTPLPPKGGEREILCEVMSEESADDFIAHRKAKRAKLTERAARMIATDLRGHHAPDEVVRLSVKNGWTGIFPERVPPPVKPGARLFDLTKFKG